MFSDEELKEYATKIARKLEQHYNFEEFEVFIQTINQTISGTEFRTPKIFQSINRAGCAIRFFHNEHLYFATLPLTSALIDIENRTNLFALPITSRKFAFPEIKLSKIPLKIYDRRIAEQEDEVLLNIMENIKIKDENEPDTIIDGNILLTYERKVITNSSQVLAFEKGTWFDLDLRVLYRGGGMVTSAEKHITMREIPNTVTNVIDDLISDAIQRSATQMKIRNIFAPIIFSPRAFSAIFAFAFVPQIGKPEGATLHTRELHEDFSLVDDGTIPSLPNTTAFDDEGVMQSRTTIFSKGEFVTYINSCQTSELQEEQTGNGFRVQMYERFPRNYRAYPNVFPSNLIIKEGKETIGEIMDDIAEGILVNSIQGYMSAESFTGNFSVSSIEAYLIENGSIKGALPMFDIKGNVYEILSKSPVFSKEQHVIRTPLTPYSIISPYVLTDQVTIYT